MTVLKRVWSDIRNFGFAILIVTVFYIFMHTCFDAFCPMYVLTGLPCPGCGITRSIIFFLTGQWRRSFYIHPMGCILILFALYCGFFRYIKGKKVPGFKQIAIGLAGVAVVLFIIRMVIYFPDRPPYTYNYGNILEKLIPGYRNLWI